MKKWLTVASVIALSALVVAANASSGGSAVQNPIILQNFQWYLTSCNASGSDGLYDWTTQDAKALATLGVTQVWMPPAYKNFSMDGSSRSQVGYAVYDLGDLGAYNQMGGIPTKYGTQAGYISTINALHQAGIKVIGDIVLDHLFGGSQTTDPTMQLQEVNPQNRLQNVGVPFTLAQNPTVNIWAEYPYVAHANVPSLAWDSFNWKDFNGFSMTDNSGVNHIYRVANKEWSPAVSNYLGNYDYLMGDNVDESSSDNGVEPAQVSGGALTTYGKLVAFGKWYTDTTGVDGYRLDAVKNMSFNFYRYWLTEMQANSSEPLFVVGEYYPSFWEDGRSEIKGYIDSVTQGKPQNFTLTMFDYPLLQQFFQAGNFQYGDQYTLRHILDGTLMGTDPQDSKSLSGAAVTFVENHDTQQGQALQAPVAPFFKPIAYAFILLRSEGTPCVFYPDLYGSIHTNYDDPQEQIDAVPELPAIMVARKMLAYGPESDYNIYHESSKKTPNKSANMNLVGWTRGDLSKPQNVMVVVAAARQAGTLSMKVSNTPIKMTFVDITGNISTPVQVNGVAGNFPSNSQSVSVWVPSSWATQINATVQAWKSSHSSSYVEE